MNLQLNIFPSNFKHNFFEDYHQYALWLILIYICGIAFYFHLDYEPSAQTIFQLLCSSSILILFRSKKIYVYITYILLAFTFGFTIAKLHIASKSTITLPRFLSASFTAQIENIKPKTFGLQLTLNNISYEKKYSAQLPQKIRLNLHENNNNLNINDIVKIKANLFPPPKQTIINGYNFARHAYFENIGAVGRIKDLEIIEKSSNHNNFISKLRINLYQHIKNLGDNDQTNIASALLLGMASAISEHNLTAIRNTGIAHILAVSGLHMSLMAGIIFFFSRLLMNCSNYLFYKYDIKKIAALLAIFGSYFYLILTGSQTASERAFIMICIFLASILFDKKADILRSLALAALIILTAKPELILTPSFQLSFIAVLSLIAGSEIFLQNYSYEASYFIKIKNYFKSIIFSSLIASLATAPIVAYHFYIFSPLSIIANLLILPIFSFLLMPILFISLILYFIGADYYVFQLAFLIIEIIIQIINYINQLPLNVINIGQINIYGLAIFLLGFFWLILWRQNWRKLGWLIIIISLPIMLYSKKPNFIIDAHAENILYSDNKDLTIYSSQPNNFMLDNWRNWYGKKDQVISDLNLLNKADIIYFENIALVRKKYCPPHSLIIDLTKYQNLTCPNNILLKKQDLKDNFVTYIYLNKNGFEIKRLKSRFPPKSHAHLNS